MIRFSRTRKQRRETRCRAGPYTSWVKVVVRISIDNVARGWNSRLPKQQRGIAMKPSKKATKAGKARIQVRDLTPAKKVKGGATGKHIQKAELGG